MSSRRNNLLSRLQRSRPSRSYTQLRRNYPPAVSSSPIVIAAPVPPPAYSPSDYPGAYSIPGYNSDYEGKRQAKLAKKQKQQPPTSKIERTIAGAWQDVKEVVSEPFVIVALVAAVLVLFLSSESRINAIVVDFLKSHNIPVKLQQLVPRFMHYLFASAPLISLAGKRRWGAFAAAGSICYVMLKQEYIAYAILGVAVRLIFQARTMQVGVMMLVIVFTVLAIYNSSMQGGINPSSNYQSSTETPPTRNKAPGTN